MREQFLAWGLSWTTSFMLPYILFFLIGLIACIVLWTKVKFKYAKLISLFVLLLPVGIYFMFNPIYEGDFSNNYTTTNVLSRALENEKLIVLSMPGCPYCYESLDKLKLIDDRLGKQISKLVVVTDDSVHLDWYKEKADGKVEVVKSEDFENLNKITQGRYPTFVYLGKDETKVWSNDNFGVRAVDWIESQYTEL